MSYMIPLAFDIAIYMEIQLIMTFDLIKHKLLRYWPSFESTTSLWN
jgi:hypothetical protein